MSSACTHEHLGGKEKTSLENKVEKAPLRIKNIGKITYEYEKGSWRQGFQ